MSVEKKGVDLSRAARGAGSPVHGRRGDDDDEPAAGHDHDADHADAYAHAEQHADERSDDDDTNAERWWAGLDGGESIRNQRKHGLGTGAEVDAGVCADVPAADFTTGDLESVRNLDGPYADPVTRELSDRPDGLRQS
jgi:hypothetical protein